ncbi:hypothetical protein DPMN_059002 [Dreissena polymorpha]|uniref:Uncharacterized protein n=1 Tax=Dreissena polymorpha TaxID=45954 RepID=A0A9D4HG49_DREPO|nr:hypothetical protein DPMN_059002 [Dreissena polymorpha]
MKVVGTEKSDTKVHKMNNKIAGNTMSSENLEDAFGFKYFGANLSEDSASNY